MAEFQARLTNRRVKEMLQIATNHSMEAAKNYFDVALKTSDYYTKDDSQVMWSGRISWHRLTIGSLELMDND